MCNFSNGLRWKRCKTIFVTEESTLKQERTALLVGYSFLNIVVRVLDGRPWLTALANLFSFFWYMFNVDINAQVFLTHNQQLC